MGVHKYKELADRLRNDIASGVYSVGEKLPSENELMSETGYSRQTVRQAMGILEQEGTAIRIRGSGTYVKGASAPRSATYNIAVVTTAIQGYIFNDILNSIYDALSVHGYAPILYATAGKVENERKILMQLLEKPVDGIMIQGTKTVLPSPNLDLYERLEQLNIPIVFINTFHTRVKSAIYVCAEDLNGGITACEYLLSKGHKEIACIMKSDDMPGVNRYSGYVSALLAAKLPIQDDNVIWFSTETQKSFQQIPLLLSVLHRCTAVICYNDEIAMETIKLLQREGIAIPDQIEIVSFDNSSIAQLSPVPFVSLEHPKAQLGKIAAEKMVNLLRGKKEASILLPWSIP